MNVDRLVLAHGRLPPYFLQQLSPRYDPPRPGGQVREQIELLTGKRQRLLVKVRLSLSKVDPKRTGVDHGGFVPARPTGPPQHRSEPGVQVRTGERLDHVVVGTGLEQPYDLRLVVAGGRDDDGYVGDAAEHPQRVGAVQVG